MSGSCIIVNSCSRRIIYNLILLNHIFAYYSTIVIVIQIFMLHYVNNYRTTDKSSMPLNASKVNQMNIRLNTSQSSSLLIDCSYRVEQILIYL